MSEVRSQKSEVRNQKPAIRSQKSQIRICLPSAVVCLLAMLLVAAGCGPRVPEPPVPIDSNSNVLSAYMSYAAESVDIMPLTTFVSGGGAPGGQAEEVSQIKVYVGLLDSFDCEIKSPVTFRFELYEYVERSSEPKGRRIVVWPDIDLTEAAENNGYWRDYLRAYEFSLDFEPPSDRSYILQVTCLCPSGRRLSDDFVLRGPILP